MAFLPGRRHYFGMEKLPSLARRHVLTGLVALVLAQSGAVFAKTVPAAKPAAAKDGLLLGSDFGIVAGSLDDQSKAVQQALDAAHEQGRPLLLPGGQIFVQNLEFRSNTRVLGQPGATVLISWLDNLIGKAELANNLVLDGIGFAGTPSDTESDHGLLQVTDSIGVRISNCQFLLAKTSGVLLQNSEAVIAECVFDQLDVAIFSHNSRGLTIRDNQISKCGNGGILIWRDASGPDGSIVTGNRLSHILARSGGDGQNGNGINVFRADHVVVSDNVIDDCAFSAIRANSASDCAIRGNTCTNLGEVAIYSEFGFSGAVISGNIVDGAATGVSITNLDQGGHLATCSGNIIRNIGKEPPSGAAGSSFGIYVEADTAVTGNTISSVAGAAIGAGYGPFLRNVLIADNVITNVDTAVGISVVNGIGAVRIAGNLISGVRHDVFTGAEWEKVVSTDLLADGGRFPTVTIEGNAVAK